MGVFKNETEFKRVIFNIRMDLAERLEQAKLDAGEFGKKLDVEGTINKSLERFLKKAEKRIDEMKAKQSSGKSKVAATEHNGNNINDEEELPDEEE